MRARTTITALLAVGTLVLAACGNDDTPAEAAAAADAAAATDVTTTIELFDPRSEVVETFLDLGEEGMSAGDTVVENTTVVDPDTGERAGRAVTRFQIVEMLEQPTEENPFGDFELILDCTYELLDGNINFYGSEVLSNIAGDGLVFTVVGGTGAYAGVTGTVTVAAAEIDGQEGFRTTFELVHR